MFVAAVRSIGVLTTNSGDLADGEGLNKRIVCVATVANGVRGPGGKGIVCTGDKDIAERISMTGNATNVDADTPGTLSS